MGKVYIIDRIFAKEDDIYEVIGNAPPKFGPLGEPLRNLLFSEIDFALRNRKDTTFIREFLDLSYDDLSGDLPSGFYLQGDWVFFLYTLAGSSHNWFSANLWNVCSLINFFSFRINGALQMRRRVTLSSPQRTTLSQQPCRKTYRTHSTTTTNSATAFSSPTSSVSGSPMKNSANDPSWRWQITKQLSSLVAQVCWAQNKDNNSPMILEEIRCFLPSPH